MRKQSNPEPTPAAQPSPKPGAMSSDSTMARQFAANQRASNETARARVSNQEGAGVQEWQTYQTPVRPADTPNLRQAARSQQAAQQGQVLHSTGPDNTPRWTPSTPSAPLAETQRAGQALHNAGVRSDNPPLSADARARIESALDSYRKIGQTTGTESRLEAAAQEKARLAPTPSETEKQTMHR